MMLIHETSLYWIVVYIFVERLGSVFSGTTGVHICNIETGFSSSYATALYEQYAGASGCVSGNLSPSSQEVHIINLRSGGPNVSPNGPNVTLHIRHHSPSEVHESPLIMVLNSHKPVVWHVEAEGITNITKHKFVITQGSKLVSNHLPMDILHRGNMPFGAETFLRWGKQHYKAVTSFTDIQQANTIFLKVGISSGTQLPSSCNLTNELSPNIMAAYIQPKPANGCIILEHAGIENKDVHVIEVHSANINPRKQQIMDVLVDVVAKRRGKIIERNLVLVLKSHREVNWKVKTKDIMGTLSVVTTPGHPVDVLGVHMESIQIYTVDLHRYHRQLLLNFSTKQYGPIVSYIEAQLANRFNILIEDAGLIVPPSSTPAFPLPAVNKKFLPFHGKLPGSQEKSARHQPPLPITVATTILGRTLNQNIIKYMMVIECQNKGIQVVLEKNMLFQRYGITNEHLTLSDPSCHAKSNQTHYILASLFNRCGMEFEALSDRVLYKNKLTVQMLAQMEGSASSPLGSDDEGSAAGTVDPELSDDEDYQRITVNFHCEYMTNGSPVDEDDTSQIVSKIHDDELVEFSLQLFDNLTAETPLKGNPIEVVNLTTVFVEASIVADQRLKVFSDECWVSSSDNIHEEGERHILIENSCPKDASVFFQRRGFNLATNFLSQRHRFSFQARQFFTKPFLHFFLHCKLSVCSDDGILGAPGIKKCINPESVCVGESFRTLTSGFESRYYKMLFRGPIKLMPILPSPSVGRQPGISSAQPDIKKPSREYNVETNKEVNCKTQHIVFEGLESASVVGIAFASFIIGVILTAALWFIHLKTDPLRRELQKRMVAAEGASQSGNSTPNSHTPMTVSA